MGRTSSRRRLERSESRQSGSNWLLFLAAGVVLLGAALFLVLRGGGEPAEVASTTGGSGQPAQVAPPTQASGPRLAIDQTEQDLGDFRFEQPAHSEFVLTNSGSQPVQIVDKPAVQAIQGCWPPRAVVGSTTIQPGQSTKLSLDFTMHEGMGGPHEFLVTFRTNDPTQQQVKLTVKSNWE